MNNADTIKAIAPTLNSYFRNEIEAGSALDIIGRILKENGTANNHEAGAGYQVTTRRGDVLEYKTAHAVEIDEEGRLLVIGSDRKTFALFNRSEWANFERTA